MEAPLFSGLPLRLLWELGSRVRVPYCTLLKVTLAACAARHSGGHLSGEMSIVKLTHASKRLLSQAAYINHKLRTRTMTPIQRLGILAFTLGLCANLPACAADRETEPDQLSALLSADDSSRFEAGITALMDSGAVAGLSVAITSDSAIVWSKGFGLRNRQTGESVDTNTVFEAASLSKPVFAYAFLQLVDEGLFDLERRERHADHTTARTDSQHRVPQLAPTGRATHHQLRARNRIQLLWRGLRIPPARGHGHDRRAARSTGQKARVRSTRDDE
jgi:hypothetical protein